MPSTITLPELSEEEEGEDPAAVWLAEEPVVSLEEVKGFESDERTAAVRSNSNWRWLVMACCVMVADVLWLFNAEPMFQAQIQGDVLEDIEESSLHVVPVMSVSILNWGRETYSKHWRPFSR